MAQVARNTERHFAAWGSSRLREQKITFVSAGNLEQEEINAAVEEKERDKEKNPDTSPALETLSTDPLPVSEPISSKDLPSLDRPGSPAAPTARTSPRRRASTSSESSEEILFAGRNNPLPTSTVTSKPATPPESEKPDIVEVPVEKHLATLEATTRDSSSSGLERFNNILYPHDGKGADGRGRARQRRKDEEDALVADYIANMTFDDDSDENVAEHAQSVKVGRRTEHFRFFGGVGETKVNLQPQPPRKSAKQPGVIDQAIDWDSPDLEDFDDFSTTDEEVAEVNQVLRFRTRPSGRQYLVNPGGKNASDPRWVLHSKLKSASAIREVQIFEEIQLMKIQESTPDSADSDSDDEEEDLIDEIESEEEENDRILKHMSRMTDEQIAMALAKQEELGLGSDQLLLLDGNVDGCDDDEKMEEDEFATGDGFIPFSTKQHLSSRTTSKRNKRQRDHFPSASALADALDQDPYGAFDVMDFDRPSLKPKKKGRKSDLPFDLGVEDPELADRLRSSWEKDREKKAVRKKEKQLEREDALLNASERNQPTAIRAEIRQLMLSRLDTLELAPMDSAQRAGIHRLAKSLRLNSKSQGKEGSGAGRYTVLTKGPHTPNFTIDNIWEIDALLSSRKYFPKMGFGSSKAGQSGKSATPGSARARRGGGGTLSGATYMNGDVVGASAPEIGAENKGRAMLERMGWSTGMGIGAVGNKGSVEVIKHVVKTTKAGLG